MMQTVFTIIAFSVWNAMDFFSTRIIFDSFYVLGESKRRNYRYLWLIYSFAVTYIYCLTKLYRPGIICNIFFFLFYLRMVPLVWSAYGPVMKVLFIVFFYEEMEAVVSGTITRAFADIIGNSAGMTSWLDDMLVSVISVVFFVLLCILQYMRHRRLRLWMANLSMWEYIILIAAIFFAGNVESGVWLRDESAQDRIFVMILMALVLLMTLKLIFVNNKNFTMENLVETLKNQMRDMTDHYRELNEKNTELRKFRHDTKNHMLAVCSMIEEGRDSQALEYMQKLNDEIYQTSGNIYQTGNYLVDSLLSSKRHIAEQYDIHFEFEGKVPSDEIGDVDIVVIFSNIIDNAVEACEKIEGRKQIFISSALKNGTCALEVVNPTAGPVDIFNNHIDTSKGNAQLHGFGLSNIEDVVEKYHGVVQIFCEKNEFTIKVMIRSPKAL